MLCASAVDAMLKEKGHQDGTLNQRINKAVEDHLLTQEMGDWATMSDSKQMTQDTPTKTQIFPRKKPPSRLTKWR